MNRDGSTTNEEASYPVYFNMGHRASDGSGGRDGHACGNSHRPGSRCCHFTTLDRLRPPAGWIVVASQPSTLDLPKSKCLSGLPTKSTANITSASVSFAERSGLPGLGEYLATGATIMSGYARSVRALATCHSLTFTQNKKTIQATISPIPLPVVGSASAAYSLRFSVAGFPIVVDIALFRTSKYLGEVIFSDSVPPQRRRSEPWHERPPRRPMARS